jgi:hypothetical protein
VRWILLIAASLLSSCTINPGPRSQPELAPLPAEESATATFGGATYGAPPSLVGVWSTECIGVEQPYYRNTHVFTSTRWDIESLAFVDSSCTKKVGEAHVGGTYVVTGQASSVANAWDIELSPDVREYVVDGDGAKGIARACGVEVRTGGRVNLLASGCPEVGVPPLSECPTLYDVVALDGDRLGVAVKVAACSPSERATTIEPAGRARYVWKATGVAACDDLLASVPAWMSCAKMSSEDKETVFDELRALETKVLFAKPTTDPDLMTAMIEECSQTAEATGQRMSALGC